MTKKWTAAQLKCFASADDFRVSPFYSDGKTYGTPTWIWSVVVDQDLYIRAWNGVQSRWYRSATTQCAGRMFLAKANHEISFEPIRDANLNDRIDQAYRRKYADSPYLGPMIQAGPRQSTLRVVPRED